MDYYMKDRNRNNEVKINYKNKNNQKCSIIFLIFLIIQNLSVNNSIKDRRNGKIKNQNKKFFFNQIIIKLKLNKIMIQVNTISYLKTNKTIMKKIIKLIKIHSNLMGLLAYQIQEILALCIYFIIFKEFYPSMHF